MNLQEREPIFIVLRSLNPRRLSDHTFSAVLYTQPVYQQGFRGRNQAWRIAPFTWTAPVQAVPWDSTDSE